METDGVIAQSVPPTCIPTCLSEESVDGRITIDERRHSDARRNRCKFRNITIIGCARNPLPF